METFLIGWYSFLFSSPPPPDALQLMNELRNKWKEATFFLLIPLSSLVKVYISNLFTYLMCFCTLGLFTS
jgi:hypothetical protein